MAVLDFFRPKWKHSKWQVREEAINSGKLSQSLLIKIIGRKKESDAIKREAIKHVKDDRKLAKLVFGKGFSVQEAIVSKIRTITILQELEKEACHQNLKMFASFITSRIEDIEIESYSSKSDAELKSILDQELSWQRTKAALEHIDDAKLLVQWVTQEYEIREKKRQSLSWDVKDSIKRLTLEKVMPHVTSLRVLELLTADFYQESEGKQIAQRIIKLNKAEAFLKQYKVRNKKCFRLLLESIKDQKKIIELIKHLNQPSQKLKAYTLAGDEVRSNGKYLCEMINIIQNSKDRVDADVEAFLKALGQKVSYRMMKKESAITCDSCNGTGRMPYCDHGEKCDSCGGSGRDGYDTYEVIESIVVN